MPGCHAPGMNDERRASRSEGVRSTIRALIEIVRDTYLSWSRNRTIRLGAGLAYYALFAIIPILTLAVWVASVFVSRDAVEAALDDAFAGVLGTSSPATSASIAGELDRAVTQSGLGIVGVGSLVVAATLLFGAFQDAQTRIWSVPVERGVRTTLRRRLLSFVVVLLLGAYLVGAVVVSTTTDLVGALVPGNVTLVDRLSPLIEAGSSWGFGVLALALTLRLLAPITLAWRHVLISGAVTAVLVVIGTQLLGIYFDRVATASLTGAAGAVALFLVWLYYEAQILLVGAELTKAIAARATPRDRPESRGETLPQ